MVDTSTTAESRFPRRHRSDNTRRLIARDAGGVIRVKRRFQIGKTGLIVLGYLCGGRQITQAFYRERHQLTPGAIGDIPAAAALATGSCQSWGFRGASHSTHQRLQLFVVREVELGDKVIEMLVAGVDVSLGPHLAHAVKVVDVDVDEHPEQTRQNLLSHLHEGLREGST